MVVMAPNWGVLQLGVGLPSYPIRNVRLRVGAIRESEKDSHEMDQVNRTLMRDLGADDNRDYRDDGRYDCNAQ